MFNWHCWGEIGWGGRREWKWSLGGRGERLPDRRRRFRIDSERESERGEKKENIRERLRERKRRKRT